MDVVFLRGGAEEIFSQFWIVFSPFTYVMTNNESLIGKPV